MISLIVSLTSGVGRHPGIVAAGTDRRALGGQRDQIMEGLIGVDPPAEGADEVVTLPAVGPSPADEDNRARESELWRYLQERRSSLAGRATVARHRQEDRELSRSGAVAGDNGQLAWCRACTRGMLR
jgi:hypothetical protein